MALRLEIAGPIAQKRIRVGRKRTEIGVTAPLLLIDSVPNRGALCSDLAALYAQYESDMQCAAELEREYEERIVAAQAAQREADNRMQAIRLLLDLEFPGWDEGSRDRSA